MSKKGAYYNEHDKFAAAWLRELIKKNLIAPGDVDERDIQQVKGSDLDGYTQVHFFAGIGGWSYALRLAGWPDDRAVWTGSCPCQPFSAAGKRQGEADARHLWPEMRRLIAERSPAICFGEQVASDYGCRWLAGVFADMEELEYRVAGADLCAAGEGAPHIRQRIWWVAHAGRRIVRSVRQPVDGASCRGAGQENQRQWVRHDTGNGCHADRVDNAADPRLAPAKSEEQGQHEARRGVSGMGCEVRGRIARATPWDTDRTGFVDCLDHKQRRIEPGISPLAHGVPARVGRLRGYGNAIVPQVAASFIEASVMAMEEA